MATYYVYAPVTSEGNNVTGKDNYCCIPDDCPGPGSCGTHGKGSDAAYSWQHPRDISKSADSYVWFKGSSNIGSIRTTQIDNAACPNNGHISNATRVEFYTSTDGSGTPIGAVLYLHLSTRPPNDVYSTNSKIVGAVPYHSCVSCYCGTHSHMQQDTGGTASAICCGDPTTIGSTKIYSWTV